MLLDVRNLGVRYRQRERDVYAVNGFDLQVAENEIVAIVGESGAGKSQAFLSITRLTPDNAQISGQAWLRGHDLLAMKEEGLQTVRGARIAYVFQDPMTALNPYLKLRTQLVEVVSRHQGLDGVAAYEKAREMFELVRVGEPDIRLNQYPHQLSGGQRQRAMLAMALLGKPELLIADEPTTALDVTVQRQVLDLLRDLQAELKFSLVLITHDLGVVARVAQRVAVMYAGRIVELGPVREIFSNACHPYTQGLLAAAPRLHGGLPKPIPGVPPKLDHLPEGCPFAPRCDSRTNTCQRRPPHVEINAQHYFVCHLGNVREPEPESTND